MAETTTIGGKEIPLTKSGLPNKRYLSKAQREAVDEFVGEKKVKELKEQKEEILKILNGIK
jgi:hypothetical protein